MNPFLHTQPTFAFPPNRTSEIHRYRFWFDRCTCMQNPQPTCVRNPDARAHVSERQMLSSNLSFLMILYNSYQFPSSLAGIKLSLPAIEAVALLGRLTACRLDTERMATEMRGMSIFSYYSIKS